MEGDFMAKNKNTDIEINTFNSDENNKLCSITDEAPSDGTCVATFSFNDSATTDNEISITQAAPANGATPPIDGELLDTKRTYLLRKSTVRKLNHLKSMNPNLNIYVSSIVDMAISHYYNYLTNNKNN